MSRHIHPVRLHPLHLPALVAAALACSIASASAAGHAGALHDRALLFDAPPPLPPIANPMPTGINTSGHNQPGVPNTSTPGIIDTGAVPSGLPGDSPTAPGFPTIVGQ